MKDMTDEQVARYYAAVHAVQCGTKMLTQWPDAPAGGPSVTLV